MFENAFSFDGRIRRTEYGLSIIIYAVIAVFISMVVEANRGASFMFIIYVPALWFLWAQAAKRCHDVGNSGWWQLIPFYGLWLLFQDGDPGSNQYGENPKGVKTGNTGFSNNYSPTVQQPSNTVGGYQGSYNGGHNNHQNVSQPNSNFSSDSSGEYNNGDLYK